MFLGRGNKKDSKSHTSHLFLLKHSCSKGILLLHSEITPKLSNGEKISCPQLLNRPKHAQCLVMFLVYIFCPHHYEAIAYAMKPSQPNQPFCQPGSIHLRCPRILSTLPLTSYYIAQCSKDTPYNPKLCLHLSRN